MYRNAYAYPQTYAQFSHQPNYYYRSEMEPPKESAVLPKNIMYTTSVEPKFIEHLMMHKGKTICIVTTAGKLEGMLGDVFIDHATLMSHNKTMHIRLSEIVYFEASEKK